MLQVDLTVSAEDAEQMARSFAASGQSLEGGLVRLLAEGVTCYESDQQEWERLSAAGVPEADPARLELQRREAYALLFSMRPRTFETEARMDELRLQVLQTSSTYKHLRNQLRVLQDRQELLRRLIDAPEVPVPASGRESLWQRVRRLVGR